MPSVAEFPHREDPHWKVGAPFKTAVARLLGSAHRRVFVFDLKAWPERWLYLREDLRTDDSPEAMSESFLRYTDLAAAIQLARSKGLTTTQIVRVLSANMTYAEALLLARRAAPLLEIKVSEFLRMRRND